ncbi:unnamed protein product [Caenorhabditis bovis]|uniref:Uncharacterized protein n=1 Tax=Caenorhabditis bovis TaxID=2654633 RepID=A0A8S1F8Q7_9PELO|nr:unnamed protein product [Caenorhabditis bovis]
MPPNKNSETSENFFKSFITFGHDLLENVKSENRELIFDFPIFKLAFLEKRADEQRNANNDKASESASDNWENLNDAAFDKKIIEEKRRVSAEKAVLEKELCNLKCSKSKLIKDRSEWETKLKDAHDNHLQTLDDEELKNLEKRFAANYTALLELFNQLSFPSVSAQADELQNELLDLQKERDNLSTKINELQSSIDQLEVQLKPTFGVSYKERNVLRIMLGNQLKNIRKEYQKSRLIEESLKSKLAS